MGYLKTYLIASIMGSLFGLLFSLFVVVHDIIHEHRQFVSLEWAKSTAQEFEGGVRSIIEGRASLHTKLKKDGIDFKKCFIQNDIGLVRLVPPSDPLFKKEITETLFPDGEFKRTSPFLITSENFKNCTSCHQHENLNIGDVIGAIVITISDIRE